MSAQVWQPNFQETSPIFEPFHLMERYFTKLHHWPNLSDLENLKAVTALPIITCSGKPVCFVSQDNSVREWMQQYEPRIYLTGEVQTRVQNWHDFFNALVWMTFPRAKAVLNQIHFQAMLQTCYKKETQRGPLRDAATLFDESGVVVVCRDSKLINLLKDFEWKELFWRYRTTVLSSMKFFVFGHGLYEKALNTYQGMTAKGIVFQVDEAYFNQSISAQLVVADELLEDFLLRGLNMTADLIPVPILGYPNWSIDNVIGTYYDNKNYFRPHPMHHNER